MGCKSTALALAIIFCSIMSPVMGFSVSLGTGSSGKSTAVSTEFRLDPSTAIKSESWLDETDIYEIREAHGSGKNLIDQSISAGGYSTRNIIDGTGSLDISTASSASDGGATVSQRLEGRGDIFSSLQASVDSDRSAQGAEVSGGQMSTDQSLVAAGGAYTRQDTEISGDSGTIAATASSIGNDIVLSGGFSGDGGSAKADLSSGSRDTSAINGDASLLGIDVISEDDGEILSSGDMMMTVDGLYEPHAGGLGSFEFSIRNSKKDSVDSDTSSLLTSPSYTSDGGDINAYSLKIYRWNQDNPQIKLYLKDDSNLRNEGLNPASVQRAITASANTWDDATNENLFADTGLVTISSTVASDTRDNKNTHAWKQFSSSVPCVAYSRTWYSSAKIGGYYSIIENDISYNTNYGWSTDGSGYDVQSIATHELGHGIGLGDLYDSNRVGQVMNGYYHGIDRDLGNGDKTGVWKLYG